MKNLFVLLVLTLSSVSISAFAATYNAHECVKRAGTGTVEYQSLGRLRNISSNPLKVECPGINHTSNGTHSAWIKVLDPSSEEDVTCKMLTHWQSSADDAAHGFYKTKKTEGFGSGWKTLNFSGFSDANVIQASNYSFRCSVPGKTPQNLYSKIGNYYINERD